MKKNLIISGAMLIVASATLGACNGASPSYDIKGKDHYTVGILQVITHEALDQTRLGFKRAIQSNENLKNKVTFIEQNAQGESSSEKTMAKSLAGRCDLLFGISTGSAQALKNARDEAGANIPVLFSAVTDPVNAGLMPKMVGHNSGVTGTSDNNPVESQVQLVRNCFPTKLPSEIKLGVLYTADEANSEVQANRAKAEAERQGLAPVTIRTATNASDIKPVANQLAAQVDAIYVPTDNTIASNMQSIKDAADNYHTLIITGEENMIPDGGHITYSINYGELGFLAGEMAIKMMEGTKTVKQIDAIEITDPTKLSKVYSSKNLADAGITLPAEALEGFTDISAE